MKKYSQGQWIYTQPGVVSCVQLSGMDSIQVRVIRILIATALVAVMSVSVFAQKPTKQSKPVPNPAEAAEIGPASGKGLRPPSGPSFYIAPIESTKGMFSVLLANGNTTVAGSFTSRQVDVFESVLAAAKDFALSDEAVGKSSPIITRLMDQHEWSLFVDVSKVNDRSKLYVTLITPSGKLTIEAGEIVRGSKKEQTALLLKMLSQVQEARVAGPRL